MAFLINNFAPIGNTSKPVKGISTATISGSPSMWAYVTADTGAVVRVSGYFNEIVNTVNEGDLIYAYCGAGSGGTREPAFFYVNKVNRVNGVVDVADQTLITVVDSD